MVYQINRFVTMDPEQQLFERASGNQPHPERIFAEGLNPEEHMEHYYLFERVLKRLEGNFFIGYVSRQGVTSYGEVFGWRQYYLLLNILVIISKEIC